MMSSHVPRQLLIPAMIFLKFSVQLCGSAFFTKNAMGLGQNHFLFQSSDATVKGASQAFSKGCHRIHKLLCYINRHNLDKLVHRSENEPDTEIRFSALINLPYGMRIMRTERQG